MLKAIFSTKMTIPVPINVKTLSPQTKEVLAKAKANTQDSLLKAKEPDEESFFSKLLNGKRTASFSAPSGTNKQEPINNGQQVLPNKPHTSGYQADASIEIANKHKLGISDNEPYITQQPVNKPVRTSSLQDTKNHFQKGLEPCYNCSDYYERDPVYYEPWHQKFQAPSINSAPHRSPRVYTPKTFK